MPLPTIRSLAAVAGVSRTTVSLALRNHPRLPLATRERIQQLAAKLGYRQDPVVATLMNSLRAGRAARPAERLSFVSTWAPTAGWERRLVNEACFFAGVKQRAFELGYDVDHVCCMEAGMPPRRLSRILYTRGIRALVIAPAFEVGTQLDLEWQHFAAVTIGYTIANKELHRTNHAHYNGIFTAMRALEKKGYRRIGYVTRSEQDERVNHAWLGSVLAHQSHQEPRHRVAPLLAPDLSAQVFKRWLEQEKPDVVISNLAAPLELLRELGYRVPRDIGYASIDLAPGATGIAGIDQLPKEVGALAADLVIKQVQHNEFGLPRHPVDLRIDGIWRDGPTVCEKLAARK
jgi:DNA-binding LacI/PurR family transcriptional regulator